MTTRNKVAVGLTLVSLGLLIPGLTQPALTIVASIPIFNKPTEIFRQTQNVIEAVRSLNETGNYFVAGLILLFSIIVPFIKMAMLAVILTIKAPGPRYQMYLFTRSISKWAMADVFAVGVFIAFMASIAIDNLDAVIGTGFYYFTGYCLVSNVAFQFLSVPPPDRGP
ncbi:MAG: paraquat-inducible protein A [Acidobacteriota bacterium]|nr:paraquat-inducible protein A [Acidobacteriota bacterium]